MLTMDQIREKLLSCEYDEKCAQGAYKSALMALLPIGTPVRINHWRGSYEATVDGYDAQSHRIRVQNHKTGKFSYAYPSMMTGIGQTTPSVEKL